MMIMRVGGACLVFNNGSIEAMMQLWAFGWCLSIMRVSFSVLHLFKRIGDSGIVINNCTLIVQSMLASDENLSGPVFLLA